MCKIVWPPPTVHKARAGTIGNPIVTPRFRVSVEGTVKYRWPISLMTDGLQSGVYPMEHHCHVVPETYPWRNHNDTCRIPYTYTLLLYAIIKWKIGDSEQ